MEKINVHERNEFVIFPPITGYSVVCRFEHQLLDKVRDAIESTVTVSGKMHYAPDVRLDPYYLACEESTLSEVAIPLIVDGKIVGGIGLSGGTSQQDGQCAKAGADALE